jgi:N-acetylglutamate synthase-like GNAT family acetyltransferase
MNIFRKDARMIRRCTENDYEIMYSIINDAARAYKGVIPADRWQEPYMLMDELLRQIAEGVEFWGYENCDELIGIMGLQHMLDVTLIRHAYVRTANRNQGIGSTLLKFLLQKITTPILIGTWMDAAWAIRFYEKCGFRKVSPEETARLLKTYWSIPERQVETSVVLAERKWLAQKQVDFINLLNSNNASVSDKHRPESR